LNSGLTENILVYPWMQYVGLGANPESLATLSGVTMTFSGGFTSANDPEAYFSNFQFTGLTAIWYQPDSVWPGVYITYYGCYFPSLAAFGVLGGTGSTGSESSVYFYDCSFGTNLTVFGESVQFIGALSQIPDLTVSTDKSQAYAYFQSVGFLGSLSTLGVSGSTAYITMESSNWQAGGGGDNIFGATVTTSLQLIGQALPYRYSGSKPQIDNWEQGELFYDINGSSGASSNWTGVAPTTIQQALNRIAAKIGPV